MPGFEVDASASAALWDLRTQESRSCLGALIAATFLERSADGQFVRVSEAGAPTDIGAWRGQDATGTAAVSNDMRGPQADAERAVQCSAESAMLERSLPQVEFS
jgi:hypothetical protein